ncbi:hypothetical protein ADNJHIED_02222 [Mannheimia haemolytica]
MEQLTFAQQLEQFFANHTLMVFAWVALLIAVIFSFYKSATQKYKIVDNAQATQLINKEEAVVVDLRSDEEFVPVILLIAFTCYRQTLKQLKSIRLINTKLAR